MRTMTMANEKTAISAMSFEAALAELEDIVEKLESGKVDLESSISIYERGEALKKHCEWRRLAGSWSQARRPISPWSR